MLIISGLRTSNPHPPPAPLDFSARRSVGSPALPYAQSDNTAAGITLTAAINNMFTVPHRNTVSPTSSPPATAPSEAIPMIGPFNFFADESSNVELIKDQYCSTSSAIY